MFRSRTRVRHDENLQVGVAVAALRVGLFRRRERDAVPAPGPRRTRRRSVSCRRAPSHTYVSGHAHRLAHLDHQVADVPHTKKLEQPDVVRAQRLHPVLAREPAAQRPRTWVDQSQPCNWIAWCSPLGDVRDAVARGHRVAAVEHVLGRGEHQLGNDLRARPKVLRTGIASAILFFLPARQPS